MKTAFVRVHVGDFIFDSESDDLEVLQQIFEKRLKGFVPVRFDVDVEDDEDYDDDEQCYAIRHYIIENGVVK